jgi:hypothetical protein
MQAAVEVRFADRLGRVAVLMQEPAGFVDVATPKKVAATKGMAMTSAVDKRL